MQKHWDTEHFGVGVHLAERIIQVNNDAVLENYLKKGKKQAYILSKYIKDSYRKAYHKELKITDASLAIEIKMHYLVGKLFAFFEKIIGKNKLCDCILGHIDIIDCGEKAVDGNRFIWNFMALFSFRKNTVDGENAKD